MKKFLFAALILVSSSAFAQSFSPEAGLWWNPAESGRGFSIEVQDEVLVITTYVYTQGGAPVWYQGVATLQGSEGMTASGELARKFNGQCIGCPYQEPETDLGFAGPFTLDFTSTTTGFLTWDAGTIPIQRFNYNLGDEWEKMLGEWQFVLDFSSIDTDDYPYSGDILEFNDIVIRQGEGGSVRQYEGFRVGSQADPTRVGLGEAAGTYDVESAVWVIVVDNSAQQFLLYVLEVGTRRFNGSAELYDKGTSPTFVGYPVQGLRSESRTEVQTKAAAMDSPRKKSSSGGLNVPRAVRFGAGTVDLKSVVGHPVNRAALQATVQRLTRSLNDKQ